MRSFITYRSKPDSRPNSFSLFSCLTEGNEATMKKPLQFTKTDETYVDEGHELLKLRQRDRIHLITQKEDQIEATPSTSSQTPRIDFSKQIKRIEVPPIQSNVVKPKRNQPKSDFEMDIIKRQDEHPSQKKDIFKAVFAISDDSDDDHELDEQTNQNAKLEAIASLLQGADVVTHNIPNIERKTQAVLNLTQIAEEVNILRNNSPPRGIFAGLAMTSVTPKTTETLATLATDEDESSLTDNVYGPTLPKITPMGTADRASKATVSQTCPNIPPKVLFNPKVATRIIRASDEWVEKTDVKHKKEKKNKKEKKEKKKHKKEKHKSHHKDKKKNK